MKFWCAWPHGFGSEGRKYLPISDHYLHSNIGHVGRQDGPQSALYFPDRVSSRPELYGRLAVGNGVVGGKLATVEP